MDTDNTKLKKQYILDETKNLVEILRDTAIAIEQPIKYRVKNAFEIFVQVQGTENYWISNYGRCVNNLNHKDKNTFYEHKIGNVHYTIFRIQRMKVPNKKKNKKCQDDFIIIEDRYEIETSPAKLVAQTFLKSYGGRFKIWHKDGNEANNWYKNLIYVSEADYKKLKTGNVIWSSLDLEQEYIEYQNKAVHTAISIYSGIKARCGNKYDPDKGKCYKDASICQEWIDNPISFTKWYLEHYYEVDGESMAVDKDLFGDGKKIYSPETCCILPQGLNTLLSNCKKHRVSSSKSNKMDLPLGVRYDSRIKMYYGEITPLEHDEVIRLSYWNTAMEAFEEYKMFKQADILIIAAKYKNKIPQYIFEELSRYEVNPYVEGD